MARRSKVSPRMCTQVALFSNSSAPLSRPSRRPKCTEPPSRPHGGARRLGGSEHRAHTTMPSRAAPPRVRPRPRPLPGALSHQLSPAAYPTPLTASPHAGPPPSRPHATLLTSPLATELLPLAPSSSRLEQSGLAEDEANVAGWQRRSRGVPSLWIEEEPSLRRNAPRSLQPKRPK